MRWTATALDSWCWQYFPGVFAAQNRKGLPSLMGQIHSPGLNSKRRLANGSRSRSYLWGGMITVSGLRSRIAVSSFRGALSCSRAVGNLRARGFHENNARFGNAIPTTTLGDTPKRLAICEADRSSFQGFEAASKSTVRCWIVMPLAPLRPV